MDCFREWRRQVDLDRHQYDGVGLFDEVHEARSATSSAEGVPPHCTEAEVDFFNALGRHKSFNV